MNPLSDEQQLYNTLEEILRECDYRERTSPTTDPWLRDLVTRLEACVELTFNLRSFVTLSPLRPRPRPKPRR